ncbi:MAG TPA: RIP metalloprotease RseP [Dysgonamonadaceae bacterium]|nr:RIP metalloprotease RseP [Dysgonamonadaceae bacterium]
MTTFFIKAIQLILSLSILVIVHEYGHYLFSRLFNIRVEKFYMFFNPSFSLVRAKKINGKYRFKFFAKNTSDLVHENSDKEVNNSSDLDETSDTHLSDEEWNKHADTTEWGVGWVPLGGYCKISGMIDESMDREQMKQPPKPWEFRSKPAWQRLLVMTGGVVFNLLLAFFIYSMIIFTWGDSYVALKDVGMGMEFSQTAKDIGFQDGDIILYADGKEVIDRFDMVDNFANQVIEADKVTVLRNGKEVVVNMPSDFVQKLMVEKQGFAGYRVPTVVQDVQQGGEADKTGLLAGDSLVAINGVAVPTFVDFRTELEKYKNDLIPIDFYRDGVLNTLPVTVSEEGTIGIAVKNYIPTSKDKYSFFASFPQGVKFGVRTLKGYVSQFKYVFTREGASSLGGFGAIGNFFPALWNWFAFWKMTAFLSIILAFMNILPIPALDGGHVMFLLYEVVTRRKPNEKFMEFAQIAGMLLLFGLLIYANGMDLFRAIF